MTALPAPNSQQALRISPVRRAVPPLENGARLDATEFMRRYEAMPELKKAELINGVVYVMGSPVRQTLHSKPHVRLVGLLNSYSLATPGVDPGDNCTVKIDEENTFQPDGLLYLTPVRNGKSSIDDDDFIVGAPELLIEVDASSVSMDTQRKMHAYEKAGVQEYIIWRTEDEAINWWTLDGGSYKELLPDADGIIRSRVFPGLWLDPKAMIADNCARMNAVLMMGLSSAEHAAFVK